MKKFIKGNGFSLCILYLYVILCIIAGLGLDTYFKTFGSNNMILNLAKALKLPIVSTGIRSIGLLGLFGVLTVFFLTFVIYEFRTSNEIKTGKKVAYVVLFFVIYILMNVIIIFATFASRHEYLVDSLIYVGETLLIALIGLLFILLMFVAPIMLIYYSTKKQNYNIEEIECELKKELVFPGLTKIDDDETNDSEVVSNIQDLYSLCDKFRLYLAQKEKLYFDIQTIRRFIASLSASRLIILEGLSGTGKSSIARCFSEFIGEKSFFAPVQTTWRDKTSILGFFNDFSKTYNETEFLKRLYKFTYHNDNINVMVLDEMNISRIEYYFADFLSIMEYPQEDWKIKIMQLPYNFIPPKHLENGELSIPKNTWFIGTANKDDSTYTITDKVYDRAITLSFEDRNEIFEVNEEISSVSLSYTKLNELFDVAYEDEKNKLSNEDLEKFKKITDYTYETFELTFGNRIMNQIIKFTPVYVACGGTKEEALDFMLSRKVLSKLEGRFEDYVKKGLLELSKLISNLYGNNSFASSQEMIRHLLRRF